MREILCISLQAGVSDPRSPAAACFNEHMRHRAHAAACQDVQHPARETVKLRLKPARTERPRANHHTLAAQPPTKSDINLETIEDDRPLKIPARIVKWLPLSLSSLER